MIFPAGVTVQFIHRTASGRDADGSTTFTDVTTPISGCAFDPGGSTEIVQGGDVLTTQPTVYLPAGVVAPAVIDRVQVGSSVYEVDGNPNTYVNPRSGRSPGTTVKLKLVTG